MQVRPPTHKIGPFLFLFFLNTFAEAKLKLNTTYKTILLNQKQRRMKDAKAFLQANTGLFGFIT